MQSFITASALFDRHITAKDVRFESDNRLIHQFDYDPFRLKAMDISRVEEEFQVFKSITVILLLFPYFLRRIVFRSVAGVS